jgi:hypothetical protein
MKHIRLLQLQPGSNDEPFQWTHVQADSVANQPYEAISYAWRDANDTQPILCQGKHIAVTRNLIDAL